MPQTFPQESGSALFASTWPDASTSIKETTEGTSSLIYSRVQQSENVLIISFQPGANRKLKDFKKCYDVKEIL